MNRKKSQPKLPAQRIVDVNEIHFGPKLRVGIHTGFIYLGHEMARFTDNNANGKSGSVIATPSSLVIQFDGDPSQAAYEILYKDVVENVKRVRAKRKLKEEEIRREDVVE